VRFPSWIFLSFSNPSIPFGASQSFVQFDQGRDNSFKMALVVPVSDAEKHAEPKNELDHSPTRDDFDRLSDTSHAKSDLLSRENVDPVLNAKMHPVNNVGICSSR
jgi:hypothetical protein